MCDDWDDNAVVAQPHPVAFAQDWRSSNNDNTNDFWHSGNHVNYNPKPEWENRTRTFTNRGRASNRGRGGGGGGRGGQGRNNYNSNESSETINVPTRFVGKIIGM